MTSYSRTHVALLHRLRGGLLALVVAVSNLGAAPPVLLAGEPAPLAAPPPASPRLEAAVASRVSAARQAAQDVGVHITDLASGATLYEHRADRLYIIASNTKLFTTATALDQLGPGWVQETPFLARGQRKGDRWQGDLAVLGNGDPNISGRNHFGEPLAVFHSWGKRLRELGIRRVEGDLYLVHGLFEGPLVHPDWPRDQLTRWYEAPVHALAFNDGCVLVRVWPSTRPGAPARVELVPDVGIFEVHSTARTGSSRRGVVGIDRRLGTNVIEVKGTVPRGPYPVEKWVTVEDPLQYFAAALIQALEDEGIRVDGKTYGADRLPQGAWRRVAVYRSDLLTTIEVINKRSQNFFAESLLKALGAARCDRGTWAGGLEVVEEFLDGHGLDTGAVELADGSGMSRGNRATPRLMTSLLRTMYFHRWGREFVASLPYSGEADLSWERRLADPPYRGNVFAKTGTLNGVSTLSGYAKGRSGRLYGFSILCNGTRGSWQAKRAQDAIVRALVDEG